MSLWTGTNHSLHCAVLCCTVLYCTVLYCTVLHCTGTTCLCLHCAIRPKLADLGSYMLYCTILETHCDGKENMSECNATVSTYSNAAFDGAPEELDVTIVEQSSQQASAIDRAAAALTAKVGPCISSIFCVLSQFPQDDIERFRFWQPKMCCDVCEIT